MAHNGKRLQVNLTGVQSGGAGSYPFLNMLKTGQSWGNRNNSTTSCQTPDNFDSDGYPKAIVNTGVYTTGKGPSQYERPGYWVLDWTGDGTVGTGAMSQNAYTNTITAVSDLGSGIQQITLQNAAAPHIIIGMPLSVSGISGGVNWSSFSGKTYTIASVSGSILTVNTGNTFTGTPTLTSAKVTSVTTTTINNGSGLNGSGRYVFLPSDNVGIGGTSWIVQISAVNSTSNYPKAIRLFHVDDQTDINNSLTFTSLFKSIYSDFGVIRFLNWQSANTNNMTTWSTRMPTTHYSYGATQMRPDLYLGSTSSSVSGSGMAYTASATIIHSSDGTAWSSGAPKDKDTIHVVIGTSAVATITAAVSDGSGNTTLTLSTGSADTSFANGETVRVYNMTNGTGAGWTALNGTWTVSNVGVGGANKLTIPVDSSAFTGTAGNNNNPAVAGNIGHAAITLNVNSGGAITMLDAYSNPIATRTDNFPVGGSNISLATLVYDATLNAWVKQGACSDTNQGWMGIQNGVPPSVMVQLCSEIGAHPYFLTPQFTCDPPTDFLPELMNYCLQNNGGWMVPRFEGPNETWNTFTGFYQTTYANAKGVAYGWGSNQNNKWYAKAMSNIGQIASAVFGVAPGAATNYCVIAGVQTSVGTNTSGSNDRLEYATWSAPASITWSGGTINFSVTAPAPTGGSTATNLVSHVCCAQYYNPSLYGLTSGTNSETTLATNFGGSRFTASSIVNGLMTVTTTGFSFYGKALAVGAQILGPGIPAGVTIASLGTGAGGAGTYQLSDITINNNYTQSYYAATDTTYADTYAASAANTVFTGTISGSSLIVSGFTSGTTLMTGSTVYLYGGTIAAFSNVYISSISGSYPNYTLTLNTSPGNQTATFNSGIISTVDNLSLIYANWATWANNHNIKKMCGYEGGYSVPYTGGGVSSVDLMRDRSRFSTVVYQQTMNNFNNFISNAGYPNGFTAEYPSSYCVSGSYPSTIAWSTLEDIYATSSPTQAYTGCRLWSNRKRRFQIVAS